MRDMRNVKILDRALNNAEVIQRELNSGALEKKRAALLAQTYMSNDDSSKLLREQILEELKGKMEKDKKELVYHTNKLLQNLNEERMNIMDKEEKLLIDKALHQGLKDKG